MICVIRFRASITYLAQFKPTTYEYAITVQQAKGDCMFFTPSFMRKCILHFFKQRFSRCSVKVGSIKIVNFYVDVNNKSKGLGNRNFFDDYCGDYLDYGELYGLYMQ